MDIETLRKVPTIQEFFQIEEEGVLPEETRLFLEAMTEVRIPEGRDIVTYGAGCQDGMYIILEGDALVLSQDGKRINMLGEGDFIGEMGLINDAPRGATVRAATAVRCANIGKELFEEIAIANRKLYGAFINMLYTKTTRLVTEQERIKSELAIATRIQDGCLEHDFTEFNQLERLGFHASMRPAKEVGGDFYDVFMLDKHRICFLIADVSGKGVPAALFMIMAKTHIRNFATVGLPLAEVAQRANDQLCYKNEEGMFVTAFICVLDLDTNELTFVNAGHNPPFIKDTDGGFHMLKVKPNLVLGMMEGIPYREQTLELKPGEAIFLYTDGITEALNPAQELLKEAGLEEMLNANSNLSDQAESFVQAIQEAVDAYADKEQQADDITMVYLVRK